MALESVIVVVSTTNFIVFCKLSQGFSDCYKINNQQLPLKTGINAVWSKYLPYLLYTVDPKVKVRGSLGRAMSLSVCGDHPTSPYFI